MDFKSYSTRLVNRRCIVSKYSRVSLVLLIYCTLSLSWIFSHRFKSVPWLHAIRAYSSVYVDQLYARQLVDQDRCDSAAAADGGKKKLVWVDYVNTVLADDKRFVNFSECLCSNCEMLERILLSDRTSSYNADDADVVMFDNSALTFLRRPPVRRDDQLFVYVGTNPRTSPDEHMEKQWDTSKFTDVFNWTFSYRADADIYVPFGTIFKARTRPSKSNEEYRDIFRRKTKNVAVILSPEDCAFFYQPTFVKELRKYIMTDNYGGCGNGLKMTCAHDGDDPDCDGSLTKQYKFYLSLEFLDSNYITATQFDWFSKDTIVVVNGVANYTDIMPEGTFIDAQKFDTPKLLAEYLRKLGQDEDRYVAHLERKSLYAVKSPSEVRQDAYCTLCSMINNVQDNNKVYPHIGRWWKKY